MRRRSKARTGSAASAGELAWRVERIADSGIALRGDGWCLGAPSPSELQASEAGLVLVRAMPRAEQRHRAHLRRGHDDGCLALGVSNDVLARLVEAWDGVGAARLMEEAWAVAVAEILASPAGWNADRAREALMHALRSRITPREPVAQIPRSPSKAPASSRCFIWVRKRAASAPSIVR